MAITNPSASELETAKKYANSIPVSASPIVTTGETIRTKTPLPPIGTREVPGVPPGAIPTPPAGPVINFRDNNGVTPSEDMRVKLLVPPKYITSVLAGPNNEITALGGIVFPYTPDISYEFKADYSAQTPLHSNFALNFYQRSSISNISINGKFSVENADEADMYLCTVHLLRALTRMRSGGSHTGGDPDSGAPPPVCRLFAYGEMMLSNVPVAITSFRVELPSGVDYFTLPKNDVFGTTSVPTLSTISIVCVPMYSRDEMQKFSVTNYALGKYQGQGYI